MALRLSWTRGDRFGLRDVDIGQVFQNVGVIEGGPAVGVLRDAIRECGNKTRPSPLDPRIEFGQRPSSDHSLEIRNDLAGLDQKFDAALHRDDGYRLGVREPIAPDRHSAGDGSGRGSAAYRACIYLFRSSTPSAPLADDTKASTKPLPLQ
jgi:hypothetical protein